MDPPPISRSAFSEVERERDRPSFPRWTILGLIGLVAVCFVVISGLVIYRPVAADNQPAGTPAELDLRMHGCIRNVLEVVEKPHPELWLYRDVWNDCVREVYSVDSLIDFDIRREKLLRKELDERVLLWMVVVVTMSGVAFAGVQIWMSYRLVLSGLGSPDEPTEMSIKNGQLALRSSVTGLFILAFSLVFFVCYVKWIYADQEVVMAHPEMATLPNGTIEGVGTIDGSAASGSAGLGESGEIAGRGAPVVPASRDSGTQPSAPAGPRLPASPPGMNASPP